MGPIIVKEEIDAVVSNSPHLQNLNLEGKCLPSNNNNEKTLPYSVNVGSKTHEPQLTPLVPMVKANSKKSGVMPSSPSISTSVGASTLAAYSGKTAPEKSVSNTYPNSLSLGINVSMHQQPVSTFPLSQTYSSLAPPAHSSNYPHSAFPKTVSPEHPPVHLGQAPSHQSSFPPQIQSNQVRSQFVDSPVFSCASSSAAMHDITYQPYHQQANAKSSNSSTNLSSKLSNNFACYKK